MATPTTKSPTKPTTTGPLDRTKNPLRYAYQQALKGGVAGASAQVCNVALLMWLRTTMNYQYRYGGTTGQVIKLLYAQGGVRRFYQGLLPALMQSPLSRFGDAAANVGVLTALESSDWGRELPVIARTAIASSVAAAFRVTLMPIDAWKTTLQVEGGSASLMRKIRQHGPLALFDGSGAALTATWAGHYPWFVTHNLLSHRLPPLHLPHGHHLRFAFIGFCSSVVSDTCSNSIRVIKTTRQTSQTRLGYGESLRLVLKTDGVGGLLGRGLRTRILVNGLQGMLFSVAWRAMLERMNQTKTANDR